MFQFYQERYNLYNSAFFYDFDTGVFITPMILLALFSLFISSKCFPYLVPTIFDPKHILTSQFFIFCSQLLNLISQGIDSVLLAGINAINCPQILACDDFG